MDSILKVEDLQVNYDGRVTLENINFTLSYSSIACLLGHSGCGKTTLLRAIAGFEPVVNGSITVRDKILSSTKKHVPPEKRNIGMVFQDFGLFPHMTVAENILFGLHNNPQKEKNETLEQLLELIDLESLEDVYPHELSRGQQQRVALARAIAPKPHLLLLDEPFSNLDSLLHQKLAYKLRELLKEQNITALMVTHDRLQAFAMSDYIGVIKDGKLLQWDTPENSYHCPINQFVANALGHSRILEVKVNDRKELENETLGILGESCEDWEVGEVKRILIRPDDILYQPRSPVRLKISQKLFRGSQYLYELTLPDRQSILCMVSSHVDINIGDSLPVGIDLKHIIVL